MGGGAAVGKPPVGGATGQTQTHTHTHTLKVREMVGQFGAECESKEKKREIDHKFNGEKGIISIEQ